MPIIPTTPTASADRRPSPVSVVLAALAARAAQGCPVFAADWSVVGPGGKPLEGRQLYYGQGGGDVLMAVLVGAARAGVLTWGRVCDVRTGVEVFAYPA